MLCLIMLTFSQLKAQPLPSGNIVISFSQIRSNIGTLAVGVYSCESEWIYEPLFNYTFPKDSLKDGILTIETGEIPYGKYAVSVLDDEDTNLEMNFVMGLPREGWGMSANPTFLRLKAPSYDECSFMLNSPCHRLHIKLNYLNRNKKITAPRSDSP